MKQTSRTLMLAALFISLLIVSVAYHSGHERTRIGDIAPALTFESAPNDALRALRGKYVLISFWSATNAPSRQAVGDYSSWLRSQSAGNVGMIAFNTDREESLFREIVKRDGLNQSLQFRLSEKATEHLMRDYNLHPGQYGTLLVNPDGRILAHNPSPADIPSIIAKN